MGTFESIAVELEQKSRGAYSRLAIASSGIKAALKAREVGKVQDSLKRQQEESNAASSVLGAEEIPADNTPTSSAATGTAAVDGEVFPEAEGSTSTSTSSPPKRGSLTNTIGRMSVSESKTYTEEDLAQRVEDMSGHMIAMM